MKFLVIAKPKHMVPPEVMVTLIDATRAWKSKFAGKMEQVWGFAGIQGGGGIINVKSLDELDEVMGSFPMNGTSDVELLPLVDVDASFERAKKALAAMGK